MCYLVRVCKTYLINDVSLPPNLFFSRVIVRQTPVILRHVTEVLSADFFQQSAD
jgi:hypothetical protein